MGRVRAALLRLRAPFQRRRPVVLARVDRMAIRIVGPNGVAVRATTEYERVERDPSDEAGA